MTIESIRSIIGDYLDLSDPRHAQMMRKVEEEYQPTETHVDQSAEEIIAASDAQDDASFGDLYPAPLQHLRGAQDLVYALDRTAIAKIVDPSAWTNEDGFEVEQDHSGTSLHVADQVITYVPQTARALTTEGK